VAEQDEITPAMIDAGVGALLAGSAQRTREDLVRDVFSRMQAAKHRLAVNSPSPSLQRFAQTQPVFSADDARRMEQIRQAVPGYSEKAHYAFFKQLLSCAPVKRLLILGVYMGRDIAYLLDIARGLGRPLQVVGVDKFSDDCCEDWPQDRRPLNWQQAGFGMAPSFEAAKVNLAKLGFADSATLHKERDEIFLAACSERFDAIYIDTSHDYATLARQIRQTVGLLTEDGLLCGDDYSDQGTWGVKRAVTEFIPGHLIFANWIWLASRDQVRLSIGEQTAIA
jgi:hypothetical protein